MILQESHYSQRALRQADFFTFQMPVLGRIKIELRIWKQIVKYSTHCSASRGALQDCIFTSLQGLYGFSGIVTIFFACRKDVIIFWQDSLSFVEIQVRVQIAKVGFDAA